MIKLLVLVALVGLGFWLWQTRRDQIMELLGKSQGGAPKGSPGGKRAGSPPPEPADPEAPSSPVGEQWPRKLSPLDVPMIRARYEKLGVWEHLSEHQGDMLRQTIIEHCKEGRVELWWAPLVDFAKYLDYQKGEMPAIIMDASKLEAVQVRKYLFALDYRLRRSGLALIDITGPDGEKFEPDHTLEDGTYKVVYRVRDRAFRFPVGVSGGQLDIVGLVRTVNGLCERKKAKGRFLLLPDAAPLHCVVYALFTTAEQVQRSRWAALPLPSALTEADVERVIEDEHSVIEIEDD